MTLSDFMTSTGVLTIAPFDHRGSLASSLHLDLKSDTDRATFATLKALFMQVLSPHVSAVLTDPEFGPETLSLKAPATKVFFSLEQSGYTGDHDAMTTLLPDWGVAAVKQHNAGAKLLVYLHPDSKTYTQKLQLVEQVYTEAQEHGVVLLVEPVLYDLPSQDPLPVFSTAWQERHLEICKAIAPVCDILKIQYPGSVQACRQISTLHPCWILLSRGVDFDTFASYLSEAVAQGCHGYAAGRAVWQELTTLPETQWESFLQETAVPRLQALTKIFVPTA